MIVIQSKNKVIVDGVEIPLKNGVGDNVTIINNRVFVDGREYVDGQWKRTLRAMWHRWF